MIRAQVDSSKCVSSYPNASPRASWVTRLWSAFTSPLCVQINTYVLSVCKDHLSCCCEAAGGFGKYYFMPVLLSEKLTWNSVFWTYFTALHSYQSTLMLIDCSMWWSLRGFHCDGISLQTYYIIFRKYSAKCSNIGAVLLHRITYFLCFYGRWDCSEMAWGPLIRTYKPVEVTVLFKRLGQFMSHTMLQDMAIKYKDASLKNNYDQIVCIMLLAKTYSPVGFRQYLALDCEFVRETSNFWHSKHFLQYTFYTFFFYSKRNA